MLDIASLGAVGTAMLVVLPAAVALALSLGTILVYHWVKYGHSAVMTVLAVCVYATGCIVTLSSMTAALISYTASL
jgi:hypothetical protein